MWNFVRSLGRKPSFAGAIRIQVDRAACVSTVQELFPGAGRVLELIDFCALIETPDTAKQAD